jgi:hypothetical protein
MRTAASSKNNKSSSKIAKGLLSCGIGIGLVGRLEGAVTGEALNGDIVIGVTELEPIS